MSRQNAEIVFIASTQGLRWDATMLEESLFRLGYGASSRLAPEGSFTDTVATEIALSRKMKRLGLADLPMRMANSIVSRRRPAREPETRVLFLLQSIPLSEALRDRVKVFVPNPEWLLPHSEWKIPLVDMIACKTRHAFEIFSAVGYPTYYLGFTSKDRHMPSLVPDRSRFLHIASGGRQKGTEETYRAWVAHPEWPHLTILAARSSVVMESKPNIDVVRQWLSDDEVTELMQTCGVHVCCSNSEGFGHSIVEAMSCGVLVLTTNRPPMKEIVSEDRGLLVEAESTTQHFWGEYAEIDTRSLEAAVEEATAMPDAEYRRRCRNARTWFLRERESFEERLGTLMTTLTELS